MMIIDIVSNIDRRLAELDVQMTQLTDARATLVTQPVAIAAATPRRRAAANPCYEVAPAGKLLALLTSSGGLSTHQLAEQANADPGQVLALLKEQEAAGQVRRHGLRAATRWHAITDEDRIAARVAELQARGSHARDQSG